MAAKMVPLGQFVVGLCRGRLLASWDYAGGDYELAWGGSGFCTWPWKGWPKYIAS